MHRYITRAAWLSCCLSGATMAQGTAHHADHAAQGGASAAASAPAPALNPWSQAEVRRIDLNAKKITLKHGFIATLGMDPMTMVFQMRDAAVLQAAQTIQPGDAVEFVAAYDKGAYLVTQIKRAPVRP
jgi:Cu/Ag efflux protein CusF